jgi:cation transporter-like permease
MTLVSPEEKFGIKMQARSGARTVSQKYSIIAGIIAIVLGVCGFFWTGFAKFTEPSNRAIFGFFPSNGYHNILYIIFGLLWLVAAFALTPAGSEGINIALAAALSIAAGLGWLGYWVSLLNIQPGPNPDNFLHTALAVATLIFGSGLIRAGSGQPATS